MTIYDIAKEAKVSISTVSRVINNKGNVDPKIKKRVENVLKKHKYQPNAIARGLATQTMQTIGVLVPDIRDSHYASIAYRIEQELKSRDFNVIICNVAEVEEISDSLLMLQKRGVDGVILIGSPFISEMTRKAVSGITEEIPVVFANGDLDLKDIGSVVIDINQGIQLAITHLYNLGHRQIVFVRFSDKISALKKEEGFYNAVKKLDDMKDSKAYYCEDETTLSDFIRTIMGSNNTPTALLLESDWAAIKCIKTLHELNLEVPGDISIIGFNNSKYCEISYPPLTSVDNKLDEIGKVAAKIIHDFIVDKKKMKHIVIEPDLCIRKSTITT